MYILGAPTNLGNRPYEDDGAARQTDRGPARMRELGIVERLGVRDLGDVSARPYRDFVRTPGSVRNEDLILEHVLAIADVIERTADFPLILGGDCSVLLGSLQGLRSRSPNLGLVYIDGHSDFNTPATSRTGGVAGMDLALAIGRGDTPLARLRDDGPLVREERVVTVAVRDEPSPLRSASSAEEVLAAVGDDDFFVHLDVDALDPRWMPFVDSPEPNGLSPDELTSILRPLLAHPRAVGMQVTIYDPRDDHDGRGAAMLVDVIANCHPEPFHSARAAPKGRNCLESAPRTRNRFPSPVTQ